MRCCAVRVMAFAALLLACIVQQLLPIAFADSSSPSKEARPGILPGTHSLTVGEARPVFVDPQTGATLWTATVERSEASTSSTGSLMGEMDGVDGVMYASGAPADHFTAAKVTYDDKKKTVTASGGVRIHSLTQKDTSLACDNLTWYTSTSKMIGTGHVVFRARGATQSGQSFQADTKMKSIVMPAPGYVGSSSIHVTIQP